VTNGFGLIIELLVAFLLALTIGYCMLLNRRLKLLRSDEHSLRATISELVTATEVAERAIAGLKLTVEECELGLGARLRSADRFTADLLSQIVAAGGRPSAGGEGRKGGAAATVAPLPKPPARSDAQSVAAAAAAFAERVRTKVHGRAA
jgi:Domain of unknown function (DUF6468)